MLTCFTVFHKLHNGCQGLRLNCFWKPGGKNTSMVFLQKNVEVKTDVQVIICAVHACVTYSGHEYIVTIRCFNG